MPTLSDALPDYSYDGEALVSESERSREVVKLAKTGAWVRAGLILAKVLLGGNSASASASGTGNGTITAVSATAAARIGVYHATCIATAAGAGTFEVTDPYGLVLGNATVGQAFSAAGVAFTINDGSTDWALGDVVSITVTATKATAAGGNTGNGTVSSMSATSTAQTGNWKLICIAAAANGGRFAVMRPDGTRQEDALVTVAYNNGGLAFTIGDGGTDWAVGDTITVEVKAASAEKYVAVSLTATDGAQTAAGVLYSGRDATDGDVNGVAILREAEVNGAVIGYPDGATDNQKAAIDAQLATLGIIVRAGA